MSEPQGDAVSGPADPGTEARALLAAARPRHLALPAQGVEIALLDWGGEAPLALLHHANGFCKGVWGLVAARLRENYRVLAMDARGHGDSSKPEGPGAYDWDRFAEDALGVAERLAGEARGGRVALGVGNSFGGTALLGAAARRPDLFEWLVLVDPVTPPPPGVVAPQARAAVRRLVDLALSRRTSWPSRAAVRARWSEQAFFRAWDPRALELYLADGLRESPDGTVELKCPAEIEAAIFASNAAIDVLALAQRVSTPTLFLWARRGDFSRAVYERIAAAMPAARVETVESGHLAPLEHPDLVVGAIERFVAGGRTAPGH